MELLGELKFYADEPLPIGISVKKALKNWRKYTEKGKKYFYDKTKRCYEVYGDLASIPEIHVADLTASSLQRIDIEKIENKRLSSTFYRKHEEKYIFIREPLLRHPITGNIKYYKILKSIFPEDETSDNYDAKFESILNIFKSAEIEAFNRLIAVSDSFKDKYFVIWRYYPEYLKPKIIEKFKAYCRFRKIDKKVADEFLNLTAYTLSPDHTLFDHADATSAIYGATCEGRKPALLMFKISPVQDFIKNARKERDLWAGSHLLSFLTFQAIKVVVDEFGPDAMIFPHLRGQPFFDKEFENLFKGISEDVKVNDLRDKLKIANIPNKFLAIVGFRDRKEIEELRKNIVESVKDTICKIFEHAWGKIITNGILENTKKKLIELKKKAKQEKDVERYEEVLKELEEFSISRTFHELDYQRLAEGYFRITLEVLEVPFDNLGDSREESYRKLKDFVRSLNLPEEAERKYLNWLEMLESFGTYPARVFDLYSLMFELIEEVVGIESRKFEKMEGKSAYKCSLCGELEAICGKNYILMKVLWDEISRNDPLLINKNEHLCPICLVKRFYHEWLNEFEDNKKKRWGIETGFESVSKVALKKIARNDVTFYEIMCNKKLATYLGLEKSREVYWNSINAILDVLGLCHDEDLFYKENLRDLKSFSKTVGLDEDEIKRRINNVEHFIKTAGDSLETIESKIGEFPRYYTILTMDGDNMGKMLIGDEMKPVKEYLHPNVFRYLPSNAKKKVEETKRLITPATHSAISRALACFSIEKAPNIVKNHRGELIYAGGDDVLALLPIDSVLACAYDIQKKFGKEWDGWNLLPAKTMSAGILIVHYKHPLYDALDKARELEKMAKEMGRDCVAVGYLKRSGSYDEVVFNWSLVCEIGGIVELINNLKRDVKPNLSKRIIYHVVQEIDSLPSDENALREYIKFEFSRHYSGESEDAKVLAEKVLNMAKNIRITLTKDDFEEIEVDIKKSQLVRANSKINGLIRNEKLSVGSVYEKLKDVLNVDRCEFYEKLYSLILKKQIKGLFILLKILVDCNADLGGASCEDNN